jgi:hypothetical protein
MILNPGRLSGSESGFHAGGKRFMTTAGHTRRQNQGFG